MQGPKRHGSTEPVRFRASGAAVPGLALSLRQCTVNHKVTTVPTWLAGALDRIHKHAKAGKVRLTVKALAEVRGLGLGLGVSDVVDVLIRLTPRVSAGRVRSTVSSEWLYVFKPTIAETVLYVKVVLRNDCLVVSFHRDESDEES